MFSTTLSRYLARHFVLNFVVLMALLTGIIFLFEAVEMLRRATKFDTAGGGPGYDVVLGMSLLKLPHTAGILMPFGILFAAIYTCWKLNKTHELIVVRAAGLSVWQFLAPLVGAGVIIGVLATTVINPVAAVMLSKFNRMENAHFGEKHNMVAISAGGIWLRQPLEDGYALIHGASLDPRGWEMSKVVVLNFDPQDGFTARIDSPRVALENGLWRLSAPVVNDLRGVHRPDTLEIPTEFTFEKIEESSADPDTIPFWRIPRHLEIMKEIGFPVTRLHMHLQSLLSQPLLFAAMVLLAAAFSLRPPRFGGTGLMVALGVFCGFFVFFMESTLGAFGASQKIPAVLAAWTPAAVSLLLGMAALFHMEDG